MSKSDKRKKGRLIFRRWYIHPKTGKKVYPKNGNVFPIWVED